MSTKTLIAAAALALALPLPAQAATDTADFGVQLVVQNACTLTAGGTAADLDFLSVTGNITSDIDATTDLTVNCNNGASYTIGLEGSNGSRSLSNGTQTVSYELYRNSGRTQAWGELASGNEFGGTGTNADQTITVYGRVPAGQSVGAGTYTDTVTATIEF
jgi:spore coat protein U-like protein